MTLRIICEKAFTKLHDNTGGEPKLRTVKIPTGIDPLTEELQTELRALVEENKESLKTTAGLHAYSKSRYTVDLGPGPSALLPHLSKLKELAMLWQFKAFLAAESGDARSATQAISSQLELARTLKSEPVLISHLVRIAINRIAVQTLRRTCVFVELPEQELAALADQFREVEDLRHLADALIGERAMYIPVFRLSKQEFEKLNQEDGVDSSVKLSGRPYKPLYYLGFFERDLNFYLRVMHTNIAVAKLGVPERLKKFPSMEAVGTTANSRLYIFSGMLLPALQNVVVKDVEGIADVRLAQVVVAVERFKRANLERIPDNLSQLVPRFLPDVPLDPFDGQPLRYRAEPDGYVCYSLGKDLKDDGGIESTSKKKSAKPLGPADQVIAIKTRSKR